MKKIPLIFGLIFILTTSCKKDVIVDELSCNFTNYRYYQDEVKFLGEMSGNYILIGIDTTNSDDMINDFIKSKDYFDQTYNYEIYKHNQYKYKYFAMKLIRTYSCRSITWIINDLHQSSIINFVHYTIQTDDCMNDIWEPIGKQCVDSYSNSFYVKVKNADYTSDLQNVVLKTNTIIKMQDKYMNNWYILEADKNSQGDALQMANYFYETELFAACEPDIIKIPVE